MIQRVMNLTRGILSRTRSVKPLMGAILVASLSIVALAQAPDPAARPDRGTRPVGSYSVSDIESISLQNGNVNLSIPLAALPPIAGGKLSFTVSAHYNSKNWDMKSYENEPDLYHNGFWTAQQIDQGITGGWRVGGAYALYQHLADRDFEPADPGCTGGLACLEKSYRYKMFLVTPDGSQHELRPLDYAAGATQNYRIGFYKDTPATTQTTMRYYSFDGSYLWVSIDPYTVAPITWDVYLPDGTHIRQKAGGAQLITDTNGNQIKIFSETDANGITITHYQDFGTVATGTREILVISNTSGDPAQVKYQMVGTQTTPVVETIGITWGNTQVDQIYNIDDRNCTDVMARLFDTVHVIKSITLPQTEPNQAAKRFSFFYNSETYTGHPGVDTVNLSWRSDCSAPYVNQATVSHGWGSLSEMDTPDGAIVKYSYLLDGNSSPARSVKGAKKASGETIVQKQVEHDGVTENPWTYAIALGAGANIGTVTGPDGSVTTENFYPHDPALAGGIGGSDGKGGLVYRTTRSNKQIIERHWTRMQFTGGDGSNPNGQAPFNPVVDAEYTTLLDPGGSQSKMSAKTMQYDHNGNFLSETDYDWIDLTQPGVTVPRDVQGVPTSFPGTTVLRTVTSNYYNPASIQSNIYAKRNLTTVTPLIVNAPKDSTTGTSQTRFSYEGQSWDNPPTTTGNLTKVSRFKSGTTWIDTSYTYDSRGNKLSVTDPNQNRTDFSYDASTHAQPTQIKVYPDRSNENIVHTMTIAYDYWTGLVTSQTDVNGKSTSTIYDNQLMSTPSNPVVDPFGRPGKVTNPQGRNAVMLYHDEARQVETRTDLTAVDDGLLKALTTHDKLGRVIKVESSEDGNTFTVTTDTVYEEMGRIAYTSNPHRSGAASTDGWTRATKDDLGRVVEIATFDGMTKPAATSTSWNGRAQTSYNAEQTTVTDQAGKQRKSVVDGLGRLVKVFEDPGGSNFETDYSYDALGSLVQVDQGSQHRYFTYDNLSRLMTAKNPEQVNTSSQMVATTYDYDDTSNLLSKTGPNTSSAVVFTYDGLNRVKTKTLSSGGTWDYTYDAAAITNAKGRLVSVVLHGGTDGYYYDSYDTVGRVTASHQITTDGGVGQSYSIGYGYDLAGNMTRETYPSGRTMQTDYDSGGRVAGVKRLGTDMYYAGGPAGSGEIQYTAEGAVNAMKLGNGRWERTSFNSRLQPTQITLDSNIFGSNVLKLDYVYGTTTTNNGNVTSQTITVPNPSGGTAITMAQTYTYDGLNRLATATETGGAGWSQTYDYDRWGNRAVRSAPTSTYIPNPALTPQSSNSTDFSAFDQGTNRLSQTKYPFVLYDNTGDLTIDATAVPMTYDAENHLKNFNNGAGQYSYDGDGRRVKKIDGTGTTVFVYNVGGQLIAEYKTGTPAAGDISYLTTDHLGSTRLVTGSGGSVKARYDYLPFGEEIGASIGSRTPAMGYGGADSTKQKFTQKERDNESGLDYFLARYYSSAQGRFTSPDPYNIILEKEKGRNQSERQEILIGYILQPQIWNKYAYTINNPLNHTDPDGRRELTAEDEERLKILWTEHHKARTGGDTQLADAIVKGVGEILQAIKDVKQGDADPENLKAVFFAIDNLATDSPGNTAYAPSGTVSNGVTKTLGPGDNKCSLFCANAYAQGAGVGFDGSGVPTNKSFFGNKYPPTANDLGNSSKKISNFEVVNTPGLGDIAGFPAGPTSVQGHSGIYAGGGAVIYAGPKNVKIQTVSYVRTVDSHPSVTYRRYKP